MKEELATNIKVHANNRVTNMFFNTLTSYITLILYDMVNEEGQKNITNFCDILKKDSIDNTCKMVTMQEKLTQEQAVKLNAELKNNLALILKPLTDRIDKQTEIKKE